MSANKPLTLDEVITQRDLLWGVLNAARVAVYFSRYPMVWDTEMEIRVNQVLGQCESVEEWRKAHPL